MGLGNTHITYLQIFACICNAILFTYTYIHLYAYIYLFVFKSIDTSNFRITYLLSYKGLYKI